MQFLEGILSSDLYEKLKKELGKRKDVRLANIAGGAYVKKSEYDSLKAEADALRQSIKDITAAADARVKQVKRDYDIECKLIRAGAKNTKAVRALLDIDDSVQTANASSQRVRECDSSADSTNALRERARPAPVAPAGGSRADGVQEGYPSTRDGQRPQADRAPTAAADITRADGVQEGYSLSRDEQTATGDGNTAAITDTATADADPLDLQIQQLKQEHPYLFYPDPDAEPVPAVVAPTECGVGESVDDTLLRRAMGLD